MWHDQHLLHGLEIADSLQERLRWSEYFCYVAGEKEKRMLTSQLNELEVAEVWAEEDSEIDSS